MKNLFDVSKLQLAMQGIMIWCVILLGFSGPISVALDNVLMADYIYGRIVQLQQESAEPW
jgi:hypothetical protein